MSKYISVFIFAGLLWLTHSWSQNSTDTVLELQSTLLNQSVSLAEKVAKRQFEDAGDVKVAQDKLTWLAEDKVSLDVLFYFTRQAKKNFGDLHAGVFKAIFLRDSKDENHWQLKSIQKSEFDLLRVSEPIRVTPDDNY